MNTLVVLFLPTIYLLGGWGLAHRLRLPSRSLEGFAVAYGLGTGVASLGLFLLVATTPGRALLALPSLTLPALLSLSAWLAGPAIRARWREGTSPLRAASSAPSILWGFGVPVLMSLVPFVLPPREGGFDALAYHLPAARRLATEGLGPTWGLLDGEFRLGFDLLFVPGLSLDDLPGSRGPAAVHLVAALALAAGIAAEARRRAPGLVALLAGIAFVLAPGLSSMATSAYVDAGVGLYVLLAATSAARALRERDRRAAVLAGLFAAFALNAKLPGGAAIPAVLLAFVAGFGPRASGPFLWRAGATAALASLPWFVRAAASTGNPFFPVLTDRFGTGWVDPGAIAEARTAVTEQLGLARDALLPVRAVARATFARAGGFEAPVWVLAFAPIAFVRPTTPERRGLLAAGLVLAIAWFAFVPLFRFGIGVWALGAVAAAAGVARLARTSRPVGVAAAGVLLTFAALGLPTAWKAARRHASGEANRAPTPALRALAAHAHELPRPLGVSSSLVAYAPPGVFALEPARNGLLRSTDFDHPASLEDACRRAGLGGLLLDETTDEGRRAIACARVWERAGGRVGVRFFERGSERTVLVVFVPESERSK